MNENAQNPPPETETRPRPQPERIERRSMATDVATAAATYAVISAGKFAVAKVKDAVGPKNDRPKVVLPPGVDPKK